MFCHMLKPNESSMLCCTGPVKPAGSFFPGWSVQHGWNIPSCSLCSHSLLCSPPSADSLLQQTQPGKAYGTCWKRALHFLTSPPSSTRQSTAQGNPVQTCQNQAKQTSQKQLECAASFLPSLSPPRTLQGGPALGTHSQPACGVGCRERLSHQTSSSGWASPGAGTNPAPSTLLSSFMDKVQLPKPGYV